MLLLNIFFWKPHRCQLCSGVYGPVATDLQRFVLLPPLEPEEQIFALELPLARCNWHRAGTEAVSTISCSLITLELLLLMLMLMLLLALLLLLSLLLLLMLPSLCRCCCCCCCFRRRVAVMLHANCCLIQIAA